MTALLHVCRVRHSWLILLVCLGTLSGCRKPIYCPVTSFLTQGIYINVYLRLDDTGQPEYLEFRRIDSDKTGWFRPTQTLFRAYGAQDVDMKLDTAGVRITLYTDTLKTVPAKIVIADVDKERPYFEVRL